MSGFLLDTNILSELRKQNRFSISRDRARSRPDVGDSQCGRHGTHGGSVDQSLFGDIARRCDPSSVGLKSERLRRIPPIWGADSHGVEPLVLRGSPFQGLVFWGTGDPGRCPGLSLGRTVGAQRAAAIAA